MEKITVENERLEKLSRDCFLYYYGLDEDELDDISCINDLKEEEIRKLASIYKLGLIRDYASSFSKCLNSSKRNKISSKYGNVYKFGKLFWNLFVDEGNDISSVSTIIRSLFSDINNDKLMGYYINIDNFALDLMETDDVEVKIMGKLVKSKLKLYLDRIDNFGVNEIIENSLEELKLCYRICLDNKWNIYKIRKIAKRREINMILDKARKYAIEYLNMTDNEFEIFINNGNKVSDGYQELINKIILLEDDLRINEYLDEYNYTASEIKRIKRNLYDYVSDIYFDNSNDEIEEIVTFVRDKLDTYMEYLSSKEQKDKLKSFR